MDNSAAIMTQLETMSQQLTQRINVLNTEVTTGKCDPLKPKELKKLNVISERIREMLTFYRINR